MLGVCGGGIDESKETSGGCDFDFASQCATELGFNYAESKVDQSDYRETWHSLIANYETPISTPTDVIINHVAKQLKQYVGVAIGGEGADEIYCGYAIVHWSGSDFDRSRDRKSVGCPGAFSQFSESLVRQYGRDSFNSPSSHYLSANGLISDDTQNALFKSGYSPSAQYGLKTADFYHKLFSDLNDLTTVQKYARVLFRVNLESLLGRLDSATMAAGLEARVPYTDHLLVEQAFRYPHHFKIDVCPSETKPWLSSLDLAQRGSLRSKKILRSVASRLMPKPLASRPKMSFPTPLAGWIDKDWKSWIANTLRTSPFAKEVFKSQAINDLARLPSSMALWNWPIINTILWGDRCFS